MKSQITKPKSQINYKSQITKLWNLEFGIWNFKQFNRGFTMIELLVAMGLFALLSGIVSGSFINIMKSQRSIISFVTANDNASLVFEQMAREFRTGSNFSLTNEILSFTNSRGTQVAYKLEDKNIQRSEGGNDSEFNALLSSDVIVESLKFYLSGNRQGGGLPPMITMALTLKSGKASMGGLEINLQTSVVSRSLDS